MSSKCSYLIQLSFGDCKINIFQIRESKIYTMLFYNTLEIILKSKTETSEIKVFDQSSGYF